MNNLNQIISSFTIEEQQRFIRFLDTKNKRNDTKNIQLFKLLCTKDNDSKTIQSTLYKETSKNAYHALRKRLFQSIIEFLANTSLEEENSIDLQVIKYIIASRSLLLKKQFKLAYKILDKAEGIAQAHHLFSLLNEIYHTKIQYAYTNSNLDFDKLIQKFNHNQKDLISEDQLNIVYAKMRQSIKQINNSNNTIDFKTLLTNTLETHRINLNDSLSFKSLYQLVTIVSISAFATNDYFKIEPFLIETYNQIRSHKDRNKQAFYHIQILFLIANTLFRNKKFESSLEYLEQMHEEMLSNQKKYYSMFKLKYHLLSALNYNYLNHQERAITTLESVLSKKHQDMEALLDIHLSLIMIYIQRGAFKKAGSLFSKFYHTDAWYINKAGQEWTIKKHLIEIILHIELEHLDLVESRLLSFKRQHSNYLKKINQQRVMTYLHFVETYYKHPDIVTTTAFHDEVEASFDWIDVQQEDIFVMSYYAWLKSKMEQQPLYKTTLDLINAARAVNGALKNQSQLNQH
jgi:tetratricopeptide (TPR) repeat protein